MPVVKITTKSGERVSLDQGKFFSDYQEYVNSNHGATVDMYDKEGKVSKVSLGDARDHYRAGYRYQSPVAATNTTPKKEESISQKAMRTVKGWFGSDSEEKSAPVQTAKKTTTGKGGGTQAKTSVNTQVDMTGGWKPLNLGSHMTVGNKNYGVNIPTQVTAPKAKKGDHKMTDEDKARYTQAAEDVKTQASETVARGKASVDNTLKGAGLKVEDPMKNAGQKLAQQGMEEANYKAAQGYVPQAMRAIQGNVAESVSNAFDNAIDIANSERNTDVAKAMADDDAVTGAYDALHANADFWRSTSPAQMQKIVENVDVNGIASRALYKGNTGNFQDWVINGAKNAKMDVDKYVRYVAMPSIARTAQASLEQKVAGRYKVKNYVDYFTKKMADGFFTAGAMGKEQYGMMKQGMEDYEKGFKGVGGVIKKIGGYVGTGVGDMSVMMVSGGVGGMTLKGVATGLKELGATKALTAVLPKVASWATKGGELLAPSIVEKGGGQVFDKFVLANLVSPTWYGTVAKQLGQWGAVKAAQGVIAGSTNMGTFEGYSAFRDQATMGKDTSGGALLQATIFGADTEGEHYGEGEKQGGMLHGMKTGGILGAVTPLGHYLSNVSNTALKSMAATAASKAMEATLFTSMDYLSQDEKGKADFNWVDKFMDNSAMIVGFAFSGNPGGFFKGAYNGTLKVAKGFKERGIKYPIDAWKALNRNNGGLNNYALTDAQRTYVQKLFPDASIWSLADGRISWDRGIDGKKAEREFQALFNNPQLVPWTFRQKVGAGVFGAAEPTRPLTAHTEIDTANKMIKFIAADGELIDVKSYENGEDIDAAIQQDKMERNHSMAQNIMAQYSLKETPEFLQRLFNDTTKEVAERNGMSSDDLVGLIMRNDPMHMTEAETNAVKDFVSSMRGVHDVKNDGVEAPEQSKENGRIASEQANLTGEEPNPQPLEEINAKIAEGQKKVDSAKKALDEFLNSTEGEYLKDLGYTSDNVTPEMVQKLVGDKNRMSDAHLEPFLEVLKAENNLGNARVEKESFVGQTAKEIDQKIDTWFVGVSHKGNVVDANGKHATNGDVAMVGNVGGKKVYVLDGDFVVGQGMKAGESDMVLVRYEDGSVEPVSPEEITDVMPTDKASICDPMRVSEQERITEDNPGLLDQEETGTTTGTGTEQGEGDGAPAEQGANGTARDRILKATGLDIENSVRLRPDFYDPKTNTVGSVTEGDKYQRAMHMVALLLQKNPNISNAQLLSFINAQGIVFKANALTFIYRAKDAIAKGEMPIDDFMQMFEGIESETPVVTGGTEQAVEEGGTTSEAVGETTGTGAEGAVAPVEPVVPTEPMAGEGAGETKPASAYDKIPKDEATGKAKWEEAEPSDTYDALMERSKGDEKKAHRTITSMLKATEDAMKKAQKAVDKGPKAGDDPDAMLEEEDRLQAELDAATARHEYWKKVAEEPQRRINEEAERAEAERKATEEAERLRQQEEANKVPDTVNDTPEDARKRGYKMVNGEKVERQKETHGVLGKIARVIFGKGKGDVKEGRMKLVEMDEVQESHKGNSVNPMHFIPEAQPKDRRSTASRIAAITNAQPENFDPSQVVGDGVVYTDSNPIVNERGEVIQGNGRIMMMREVYGNAESAERYKQYLKDHAEELGLKAEDIDKMKNPVLVTELGVDDAEAIRLGQMTNSDLESGGTERIKPENTVKKMGDKFDNFIGILMRGDEDMSVAQLIDQNGIETIKWMNKLGFITNTQLESAVKDGKLTAEGKNDLMNLLKQRLFEGAQQTLPQQFDALPAKAQKAILANYLRDMNVPQEAGLLGDIRSAVQAFSDLMQNGDFAKATTYEQAKKAINNWLKELNAFEGVQNSEKYSTFALELAARMKTASQKGMSKIFDDYYQLVGDKRTQELGMFDEAGSDEVLSKAEAIKKLFNIDINEKKNDGVQGSNDVAGNSEPGTEGERRGTGDGASGEQPETGEPGANGGGRTGGNGEGGESEVGGVGTQEPKAGVRIEGDKVVGKYGEYNLEDARDDNQIQLENGDYRDPTDEEVIKAIEQEENNMIKAVGGEIPEGLKYVGRSEFWENDEPGEGFTFVDKDGNTFVCGEESKEWQVQTEDSDVFDMLRNETYPTLEDAKKDLEGAKARLDAYNKLGKEARDVVKDLFYDYKNTEESKKKGLDILDDIISGKKTEKGILDSYNKEQMKNVSAEAKAALDGVSDDVKSKALTRLNDAVNQEFNGYISRLKVRFTDAENKAYADAKRDQIIFARLAKETGDKTYEARALEAKAKTEAIAKAAQERTAKEKADYEKKNAELIGKYKVGDRYVGKDGRVFVVNKVDTKNNRLKVKGAGRTIFEEVAPADIEGNKVITVAEYEKMKTDAYAETKGKIQAWFADKTHKYTYDELKAQIKLDKERLKEAKKDKGYADEVWISRLQGQIDASQEALDKMPKPKKSSKKGNKGIVDPLFKQTRPDISSIDDVDYDKLQDLPGMSYDYRGTHFVGLNELIKENEKELSQLTGKGIINTLSNLLPFGNERSKGRLSENEKLSRINELNSRITELKLEQKRRELFAKNFGRKYNLSEDGSISLKDLKRIFDDYNQDDYRQKIFYKLLPLMEKRTPNIKFKMFAPLIRGAEGYATSWNHVRYSLDALSSYGKGEIAQVVTHELLHNAAEYLIQGRHGLLRRALMNKETKKAVDTIERVYNIISKHLPNEYAATSASETLADVTDEKIFKFLKEEKIDKTELQNALCELYEDKPLVDTVFEAVNTLITNQNRAVEILGKIKHPQIISRLMEKIAERFNLSFNFSGNDNAKFVGEKGADDEQLKGRDIADEMEKKGKDALAIKVATGWERGADGKWRYEMSDGKVKEGWRETGDDEGLDGEGWDVETYKLSDMWDDEELFKAYPDMADCEVVVKSLKEGTHGKYIDGANRFEISDKLSGDKLRSVMVHEIQHAIQHREGFSTGTSPDSSMAKEYAAKMAKNDADIEEFKQGYRNLQSGLDEATHFINDYLKGHAFIEGRTERMPEYKALSEEAKDYVDYYLKGNFYDHFSSWDRFAIHEHQGLQEMLDEADSEYRNEYYRNKGGEVESRNVEKRMDMSAEERRNTLALSTEDVSRDKQINTFDSSDTPLSAVLDGPNKPIKGYEKTTEGEARRMIYGDADLVRERRKVMNLAKSMGGQINNASAGAFNYDGEVHGVADASKAEEIGRRMIPQLRQYRAALYDARDAFFESHEETAGALKAFNDTIRDVEDAIDWYTDFYDGENRTLADHDGIRYRFIGEKGAKRADESDGTTQRISDLEAARTLDDMGTDAKSIKMATGWEKGADGKWRYEEPDIRIEDDWYDYVMSLSDEERKTKVFDIRDIAKDNDILEDFIAEYPELGDVKVVIYDKNSTSSTRGSYQDSTNTLYLNPKDFIGDTDKADMEKTMVHEFQHYIQKQEGFARGGNTFTAKDTPASKKKLKIYQKAKKALETFKTKAFKGNKEYNSLKKTVDRLSSLYTDEYQEYQKKIDAWEKECDRLEKAMDKARDDYYNHNSISREEYEKARKAWFDKMDERPERPAEMIRHNTPEEDQQLSDARDRMHEIEKALIDDNEDYQKLESDELLAFADYHDEKFNSYKKIAGEVEARNVSERINMSAEERRRSLAEETEDVARKEQDVKLDDVDADSLHYVTRRPEQMGDEAQGALARAKEAPKTDAEASESSKKIAESGNEIVQKLGGKGVVHTSMESLDERGKKVLEENPDAMGWYDSKTGEVHIIAWNCPSEVEMERTILHEKVGHEGLRKVMGEENYKKFLRSVWENLEGEDRKAVIEKAKRNGWDFDEAVDEYMAEKAEDYGTEREDVSSRTGLWQKVKEAWRDIKGALGFKQDLTEQDIVKALWLSKHAMENKTGSLEYKIRKAAFENRLKRGEPKEPTDFSGERWGDERKGDASANGTKKSDDLLDGIAYRTAKDEDKLTPKGREVRRKYEEAIKSVSYLWTEAHQQALKSLDVVQNLIAGGKEKIKDANNALWALNRLGSKNQQEQGRFEREVVNPVNEAVKKVMPFFDGESSTKRYDEMEQYVGAKTGLERNRVMFVNKTIEQQQKDYKAWTKYSDDYQKEATKQLDKLNHDDISEDEYLERMEKFIMDKGKTILPKSERGKMTKYAEGLNKERVAKNITDDEYLEGLNKYLEDRMPKDDPAKTAQDFYNLKQGLYAGIKSGTHTYRDYIEGMDAWIKANLDAGYNAGEHDYSGLSDYRKADDETAYRFGDGTTYDDKAVLDHIMNCEGKMGKDNVDALWNSLHTLTDYSLKKDYDSGITSKKQHENAKAMFNYYMPLRGFAEDTAEDTWTYMNNGGHGGGVSTMKKTQGRITEAKHPIATAIAMGDSSIMRGNRNAAKQALLRLVRENENDLIRETEVVYQKTTDPTTGEDVLTAMYPKFEDGMSADEVAQAIDDFKTNIENMKAAGDEIVTESQRGKMQPLRVINEKDLSEHCIRVKVNGQTKTLMVFGHPRVAQAVNGLLVNSDWGAVGRKLKGLNSFMSQLNTTYSLTFIARNAARDFEFATMSLEAIEGHKYTGQFVKNYATLGGKAFGNMGSSALTTSKHQGMMNSVANLFSKYKTGTLDMSNEVERYFKEYVDNGGVTGYVQLRDVDAWQKKMDQIAKGLTPKGKVVKGKEAVMSIVGAYGDLVSTINEAVENQTRFAAYMTSRQNGRSVSRSVNDAKEVSVNFNKTGAGSATLSMRYKGESKWHYVNRILAGGSASYMKNTTIFYNAGVQGMARAYESVFGGDKKRMMKGLAGFCAVPFTMGLMLPMANAMIASALDDDDDKKKFGENPYAQLPEYDRQQNICLYMGHGTWFKMPMAIELRAMMGIGDLAAGWTYMPELRPTSVTDPEHWTSRASNATYEIVKQLAQITPTDVFGGSKVGWNDWKGGIAGVLVPSAVQAPLAMATNVGWTGTPISKDNDYNKEDPEYTKALARTKQGYTWLSKGLNDITGGTAVEPGWIDLNPAKMQYLMEQTLGGPAKDISQVFAEGANAWKYGDVDFGDVPVVKAMYRSNTPDNSMSVARTRFYAYLKEARRTEDIISGYKKDGKTNVDSKARYEAWRESPAGARSKIITKMYDKIKDLQAEMKSAPTPQDRDAIQEQINIYTKHAVDMMDLIEQNRVAGKPLKQGVSTHVK